MLKAWASMKSFRPKNSRPKNASGEGPGSGPAAPPQPGRNGEADFRKTKRSNATHASTTDKDARLYRKGAGQESRRAYLGHALMENRNGLVAAAEATLATGTAEREAAALFSQRLPKGATLGADKGYDAEAFIEGLKARGIAPHVAINGTVSKHGKTRKTAVPSAVAASVRYAISQRLRKRIEEGFGWTKTVGGQTQVKVRGLAKVRAAFVLRHGRLQHRPPAQAYGPDGRASRNMKSQKTRTQLQAKTSKMSPIHPQKIPLPPLSRKRTDFFSSLLEDSTRRLRSSDGLRK